MKNLSKISILSILLCSCAVGDDYEKPQFKFTDIWKSETEIIETSKVTVEDRADTGDFISSFEDEKLNQLLEKARQNNLDLKIAESRIIESRAGRRDSISNFLPQITGSADASKTNLGFLTGGREITLYESAFDATWEIDIFGGSRRKLEASEAAIMASAFNRENVLVSLEAELTRNYIEVRNFQNQIKIANKLIDNQNRLLKLVKEQNAVGLISNLEVEQSKALLENTKANLPNLETALEQAKNRIAVLLGEQPGVNNYFVLTEDIPVAKSKLVLGAPVDAISNRPDIKIAEQNMIEANAIAGAALSELYPKITLNGRYGSQDTDIADTASDISSYGIGATMPIFRFGAIRSQIDIADERKQQAYLNYEKTILQASEEINNALTAYVNEEKRRKSLSQAVAANRKAVGISRSLYKEGVTDFINVLNSERAVFENELMLVESEAMVAKNLIALHKAIGGGQKIDNLEN